MPAKGLQLLCFVAALSFSAGAAADEAKRSFLGDADLKGMVLSPTPLGPPAEFEPSPSLSAKPETFDARTDAQAAKPPSSATAKSERATATAKSEQATPPKLTSKPSRQKATAAARNPKATTAARKKANPLDSFARDARRQTWPCTGGGICNWK